MAFNLKIIFNEIRRQNEHHLDMRQIRTKISLKICNAFFMPDSIERLVHTDTMTGPSFDENVLLSHRYLPKILIYSKFQLLKGIVFIFSDENDCENY